MNRWIWKMVACLVLSTLLLRCGATPLEGSLKDVEFGEVKVASGFNDNLIKDIMIHNLVVAGARVGVKGAPILNISFYYDSGGALLIIAATSEVSITGRAQPDVRCATFDVVDAASKRLVKNLSVAIRKRQAQKGGTG